MAETGAVPRGLDYEINQLLDEAKAAVRERNLAKAIESCEQALTRDGKRADVHGLLATCLFLGRNYPRAIEHYDKAAQLDPIDGKYLINLGAVLNRAGDHKRAVDVLRRGVAKARNSSEGYYNLAFAYRALGQSSMAISAYREALRLDPGMVDAHVNLANVFTEMGNTQQATRHYKQALDLDPGSERARAGLARTQRDVARAKESASPFGRLVDPEKYKQASAIEERRSLSDEEREVDRAKLRRLAGEARTAAKAFLAEIKEQLESSLLKLTRSIQQGDDPYALAAAYDGFMESAKRFEQLRRDVRKVAVQVRGHEEMVNTPDLPLTEN